MESIGSRRAVGLGFELLSANGRFGDDDDDFSTSTPRPCSCFRRPATPTAAYCGGRLASSSLPPSLPSRRALGLGWLVRPSGVLLLHHAHTSSARGRVVRPSPSSHQPQSASSAHAHTPPSLHYTPPPPPPPRHCIDSSRLVSSPSPHLCTTRALTTPPSPPTRHATLARPSFLRYVPTTGAVRCRDKVRRLGPKGRDHAHAPRTTPPTRQKPKPPTTGQGQRQQDHAEPGQDLCVCPPLMCLC